MKRWLILFGRVFGFSFKVPFLFADDFREQCEVVQLNLCAVLYRFWFIRAGGIHENAQLETENWCSSRSQTEEWWRNREKALGFDSVNTGRCRNISYTKSIARARDAESGTIGKGATVSRCPLRSEKQEE